MLATLPENVTFAAFTEICDDNISLASLAYQFPPVNVLPVICVIGPFRLSVPLSTCTVPVLLNEIAEEMLVCPVPADFRNMPALLITFDGLVPNHRNCPSSTN